VTDTNDADDYDADDSSTPDEETDGGISIDVGDSVESEGLSDRESAALERVRTVADLMDEAVTIPKTDTKIGLDSIVGLMPVSGDLVTGAVSLYIVAEAARVGVPRGTLLKMLANVAIDVGVGSIPVIGDIFDVFFKSNQRNADALERYLTGQ
jgi:hypothetical protein